MFAACLTAFVAGFVAEGICTKWVQAVAAKRAPAAGLFSALWAACMLLGITEATRHGLVAGFWVAGYGLGSYVAVRWL